MPRLCQPCESRETFQRFTARRTSSKATHKSGFRMRSLREDRLLLAGAVDRQLLPRIHIRRMMITEQENWDRSNRVRHGDCFWFMARSQNTPMYLRDLDTSSPTLVPQRPLTAHDTRALNLQTTNVVQ